ncbi:hypothetical protein [Streptomyces sp900116325]|uniref:hypothetical protein n=1 Tax=Streptomyces sp. 900116325 TaxID=3154295 RepID=UPI0033AFA7F0
MHDRPRMEEALDLLRAELEVGRSTKTELLGGFDSWFFHDANADLDEWLAAMEVHLELLLARGPSEIDVYEESV